MHARRKMSVPAPQLNQAKLTVSLVKANRCKDNRINRMAVHRFLPSDTPQVTNTHKANMHTSRAAWSIHKATVKSIIHPIIQLRRTASKDKSTSNVSTPPLHGIQALTWYAEAQSHY